MTDGAEVTTGMVGTVGATTLVVGTTLGRGTIAAELTPRLPTSVESRGMPVRGAPPCVVGDVGIDDAARLPEPEPEPHMPDMPEVSIMADVVGTADPLDIPIADVPGIAVGLDAAAVAGIAVPTDMPPPSKEDVDPNIVVDELPMVEQPVPIGDVGVGLTPGVAISVAPSGIPVPPTGVLGSVPSGEVAESEGVGVTAVCANAGPASKHHAATNRKRLMISSCMVAGDQPAR